LMFVNSFINPQVTPLRGKVLEGLIAIGQPLWQHT